MLLQKKSSQEDWVLQITLLDHRLLFSLIDGTLWPISDTSFQKEADLKCSIIMASLEDIVG